MKNLDRYTATSLSLPDFLSDPVRRIILAINKCDHLLAADRLLDEAMQNDGADKMQRFIESL